MSKKSLFLAILCLHVHAFSTLNAVPTDVECFAVGKQLRRNNAQLSKFATKYKNFQKKLTAATKILRKRSQGTEDFLADVNTRLGTLAANWEASVPLDWHGTKPELVLPTVDLILSKTFNIDTLLARGVSTVADVYEVVNYSNGRGSYSDGCPNGTKPSGADPKNIVCLDILSNLPSSYSAEYPLDYFFGAKATATREVMADRERWLNQINEISNNIYKLAVDRSDTVKNFIAMVNSSKVGKYNADIALIIPALDNFTKENTRLKGVAIDCKAKK